MKNETEQKRGHLVRKMTLEKKETANDAHGGVRHKKGMNQARSGSKSPVCRLYAHGVRRVVHRGAPQVPPHCAVKGEPKRPSRMGKNKKNNRIKRILRTNVRRRKCVEIVGKKIDENSTMNV